MACSTEAGRERSDGSAEGRCEAQIEIQLIAVVDRGRLRAAGVFLVLRRMAMLSDAISHSILLGIVLAFFVVENLTRRS